MTKLLLKPGVQFAPFGSDYTDPKTGKKFDGYNLSIEGAVYEIIRHRQANPAKYNVKAEPQAFDYNEVKQEFLRHLSGLHPNLFREAQNILTVQPANIVSSASGSASCSACGSTDIEEIICPTCSGRRVTGHKCRTCGANLL